jgi:hypothetical protein
LEIDELVVRRLQVTEQLSAPQGAAPEGEARAESS